MHAPLPGDGGSSKVVYQLRPFGLRKSATAPMTCALASRSKVTSVRESGRRDLLRLDEVVGEGRLSAFQMSLKLALFRRTSAASW